MVNLSRKYKEKNKNIIYNFCGGAVTSWLDLISALDKPKDIQREENSTTVDL